MIEEKREAINKKSTRIGEVDTLKDAIATVTF